MKGFIEFINEAYTPEMKAVFNSTQLKQIGDHFAKLGISVQKSQFKHFTKKTFKPSIAAEHGYAVAKTTDGMWLMFEFKNRMVYNVIYREDETRYFSTVKEAIASCTDFFVFEDKSELEKGFHYKRAEAQRVTDKLEKKAVYLEKKAKVNNDYTKKINDQIRKYGYTMTAYVVEDQDRPSKYSLRFSLDCSRSTLSGRADVQLYARAELGWGSLGQTMAQISNTFKTGFEFSNVSKRMNTVEELEKYKKDIDTCIEVFNILSNIDAEKLPLFTYEEYQMLRK